MLRIGYCCGIGALAGMALKCQVGARAYASVGRGSVKEAGEHKKRALYEEVEVGSN